MSAAALLASACAALAVFAVWEGLTVLEGARGPRALGAALAPLAAARRRGSVATTQERRRVAVLAGLALLAAGGLALGPRVGILAGAGGPLVARRLLAARRERWRAELARGAPGVARSLADAIAAGHSLRGALAAVAPQAPAGGAVGAELRAAARALALGAATEPVLERLRRRARDPGWDAITAGVLLARDHGGDLVALLRATAEELDASARLRAEVRTATAQARLTAWIVGVLPVGGVALAELASPGYGGRLLSQPASGALVVVALGLQVAGAVLVRRIAAPAR